MRDRFLREGLENFEDYQVLEMLLFYCLPRRDTKALAKDLIVHFGSLSQVLEAPAESIAQVEGVGENTATFLALVAQATRYYQVHHNDNPTILNSTELCGRHLIKVFAGRRNETVYLMCLDAKCKLLCCKLVGEGSVNSAAISVRKIVEAALAVNATTVVLAHNHPSGLALPSTEDIVTTRRVAQALSAVDVLLADHIVVADDDFVSLKQSGYYHPSDSRLTY